jgi:hypothetical protein
VDVVMSNLDPWLVCHQQHQSLVDTDRDQTGQDRIRGAIRGA